MRILKIILAVILFWLALSSLIVGIVSFIDPEMGPVAGVIFIVIGVLCVLGGLKLIKNLPKRQTAKSAEYAQVAETIPSLSIPNSRTPVTETKPSIKKAPISSISFDYTEFLKLNEEIGNPDEIEFELLPDSEYDKISERLEGTEDNSWTGKPLAPQMIEKYKPLTILYMNKNGTQSKYEIIPHKISSYMPSDNDDASKTCWITLVALPLPPHEEYEFNAKRILAAWCQGQEINAGEYLAGLCRKTEDYKKAVEEYRKEIEKYLEIAKFTVVEIKSCGLFKPEKVQFLTDKINEMAKRGYEYNDPFSYEDCLALEEKKALGLNTRKKFSRELIDCLSPKGLQYDEPREILKNIWLKNYFAVYRKHDLEKLKKLGTKTVEISCGYGLACEPVKRIEKVWLIENVPELPLPDCTAVYCSCSYQRNKLEEYQNRQRKQYPYN